MTEQEVMYLVITDGVSHTDFKDPHWAGIDRKALNSCFDKGLIRWDAGKVSLTPLGSITCGGDRYFGASMGNNEREI